MTTSPKTKDGFRRQALDLIEQVTQRKHMITYPTLLVEYLGDHQAAALLMQILYWGDRTTDPEGWFYKSYPEWQKELGLSEYQVRRCIDGDPRTKSDRITLRDLGVETKVKKAGSFGAPICHYRLNREVFIAVLVDYLEQAHGFDAGQGSQQCPESIPDNVEDRSLTSSGIDLQQSGDASSDTQISTEILSEITLNPMPTPHTDEIESIFVKHKNSFGNITKPLHAKLIAEYKRLGTPHVTDVLDRCVGRGRSWHYVVQALANEAPRAAQKGGGEAVPYDLPDPQATLEAWQMAHDEEAEREAQAALPKSERVELAVGEKTAKQVWKTAKQQLELQLERPTFETWLKAAFLVDYEPETEMLVIAVPNVYERDYCQNRLYRTLARAVAEAAGRAGEGLQLCFLTREAWVAQRSTVAA